MHPTLRREYDLLQQKGRYDYKCIDSDVIMIAAYNRYKIDKEKADGNSKKRNALLAILGEAIAKLAKALACSTQDQREALSSRHKKLSRTDLSDCNTIKLSGQRDQVSPAHKQFYIFE
jgi:hypothetical protein